MGHVWVLLVLCSVGWAASPQYSDSYLAASLQVMMNLLDQLQFQKHGSEVSAGTESTGSKPDEPTPIKASFKSSDNDKGMALFFFADPQGVPASEETEAQKRLMDLYVVLSGEAKRQGIGKTQGFSDKMLARLEITSHDSAAGQLSTILKEVLNGGEAKREASRHLVKDMITLLDDPSSNISVELINLEPLSYRQ